MEFEKLLDKLSRLRTIPIKPEKLPDALSEINNRFLSETRLHYSDIVPDSGKQFYITYYPDGSRSFDDLFSSICMVTMDGSPVMSVFGSYLLQHTSGKVEFSFEDGFLTPAHKNNYIELNYVIEGRFHKQIEGKDYIFDKGDFLLINHDVENSEYMYSRNFAVITMQISNSFFDKTMNHSDITLAGNEAEEFFNRYIIKGRSEYLFIRCSPKEHSSPVPALLEQIIDELIEPRTGSAYIVMGYAARLLSLLPLKYKVTVERRDRKDAENRLFEKIRFLLEDCYEDVSIRDLVAAFGYNADYFNRLIKRHTGMTYSAFLQNIRLEKANLLLRTTEYPVVEIARKVGYSNVGFFYKIFTKKFQILPNEMRKKQNSAKESD
jgi:AraC-like DNA-binding protein